MSRSADRERSSRRLGGPLREASGDGRTVYGFEVESFPDFYNNLYLIEDGDRRILVDTGSGFDDSNRQLLDGLSRLDSAFGLSVGLEDVDVVIVTHGHMDHFGGVGFVRRHTEAPIGIHVLDRRVLSHYEERLVVAARSLDLFLESAGVGGERRTALMKMYTASKARYRSLPVDFDLEEGTPTLDPRGGDLELEVLHVPGHCPGQVCLRVGELLLSADHVLSRITPHQAPESITLNTGLGHYLASLDKVERLEGIRLALGGHEAPIPDLPGRVAEIREVHQQRFEQILELCDEPRSIAELSRELFGRLSGYNVLLGLEETGAHVEYLHLRGELVATNLDEIEQERNPTIRFVSA